jgi:S-adenosylmethionine uptake transporter
MPPAHSTRPAIAFAVAAFGIGTFSLMDAAMKDLALAIGAYNAVLWRNGLGSLLTGVLFLGTRQRIPMLAVLKLHLWRSFIVALMAVSFFWSLTVLPLAEAIGLSFIAPVIALYLAAVLLGETIGREAIIASIAGLGGVAIILVGKFSGDYSDESLWGAAAVLFSAVVFAYNLILARQQAQQAGPIEIAFFQNLFTAAILALAAPWFFQHGCYRRDTNDRRCGGTGDYFVAIAQLGLCPGGGAGVDSGRIYRLCLGGFVRLGLF